MTLRSWLVDRFFRAEVEQRIRLAIPVRDDAPGYREATTSSLQQPWADVRSLIETSNHLGATHPLAARILALTTDFVVGAGPEVTGDAWALSFWHDPRNRLDQRLHRWCDELSRTGELFLVLSRNPASGMSYVREVPAVLIDHVETDPHDLECELSYHQLTQELEGITWQAAGTQANADQVMLHYTINRPVGQVRGRSDLAAVITWLEHYTMWLEDRVRINRYKGAYLWQVKVTNALPGQLEAKRAQYGRIPQSGSILVTDAAESWTAVQPNIGADDVSADGKALRLAISAGAGIPLHWLGEGESTNRATAREMNAATLRHYAQREFELILVDVVRTAARRAGQPEPRIAFQFAPLEASGEIAVTPSPEGRGTG
ncbi:MAG: hypothetical protein ACYCZF_03775 [Anaerolineae bacterium]